MIIIDYYSKGESHSDVNSAMIGAMLLNSEEKIFLFAERKHYERILSNLENYDISKLEYIEIEAHPEKQEYKRLLLDYNYVKQIFNFANKHNETKILSLYTTTIFLYIFKCFLLFNKKLKGISAVHSELERLCIKKYMAGIKRNRFLVFLYILFFSLHIPLSINIKNFKILVYGESIKQNLIKKLPCINSKNIIAINHPYITKEINAPKPFLENNVNFGVIGLIDTKKNGKELKYLLNDLKNIENKNFKISMIGHFTNDYTIEMFRPFFEESFIEYTSKDTSFIPKELRDLKELQVDYNIFTYKFDGYKLTASGAFMDAVCFEKPIIALKNDFFTYYFEKYGNIGYLCNTYEEFKNIILSIINKSPKEEYLIQKANIKNLKKEIDFNYLAKNIGGKIFEF